MSAEHLESSSFDNSDNTVVEESDKNPDYKLVYENAVEDKDKAHEIANATDRLETKRAELGQRAMELATGKRKNYHPTSKFTKEAISNALTEAERYRVEADEIADVIDSTYDRVAALQGKTVPSKEEQDN